MHSSWSGRCKCREGISNIWVIIALVHHCSSMVSVSRYSTTRSSWASRSRHFTNRRSTSSMSPNRSRGMGNNGTAGPTGTSSSSSASASPSSLQEKHHCTLYYCTFFYIHITTPCKCYVVSDLTCSKRLHCTVKKQNHIIMNIKFTYEHESTCIARINHWGGMKAAETTDC